MSAGATSAGPASPAQPTVRVWDPLVRALHWGIVACFALAWATAEGPPTLHDGVGYVVLALIAVRLGWGLVGPGHARFASFVRSAGAVLGYARALLRGREPRHQGHNALGGWMIVALLSALTLTAGSGWLMTTDRFWGVGWVEELHEAAASLTLVLVALHVAGVALTSWRHRENLVAAMLHGRKRA